LADAEMYDFINDEWIEIQVSMRLFNVVVLLCTGNSVYLFELHTVPHYEINSITTSAFTSYFDILH